MGGHLYLSLNKSDPYRIDKEYGHRGVSEFRKRFPTIRGNQRTRLADSIGLWNFTGTRNELEAAIKQVDQKALQTRDWMFNPPPPLTQEASRSA